VHTCINETYGTQQAPFRADRSRGVCATQTSRSCCIFLTPGQVSMAVNTANLARHKGVQEKTVPSTITSCTFPPYFSAKVANGICLILAGSFIICTLNCMRKLLTKDSAWVRIASHLEETTGLDEHPLRPRNAGEQPEARSCRTILLVSLHHV